MTKRNKRLLGTTGIVLLLVMVAFFLRGVSRTVVTGTFGWVLLTLSWHLIPCGLLIAWCVSISKRILQDQVRRYLLSAGLLMLFWMVVRTVKWEFFLETCRATRMCWYAFYIPIILIPMIGVFVANYAGRPEDYEAPRGMNLLYIPALLLIALVFTNDVHQKVFAYPKGIGNFGLGDYSYRWGYFTVLAWVGVLTGASILTLFRKSRSPGRYWRRKLPLFVLGAALIYGILYGARLLVRSDITLGFCIFIVALLESCIQSGLLRSNTGYETLLESTTVAAQIVDRDNRVCYASGTAGSLTEEQMLAAEQAPVRMGQRRLSSAPITGGRVLWQDDVSHINRLMDQLRETGVRLAEEGDLLRAEIALREKQAQVDEQSRLYDQICREISGQLDTLEALLRQAEEPGTRRQSLEQVCVISAYVKRRSNLLLAETEGRLDARELEYCLRESLDNLRLRGTACLLDSRCEGMLDAKRVLAAYDMFEAVLEPVMLDLSALMVRLEAAEEGLRLRMQLGTERPVPVPEGGQVSALGGTMTHSTDAGTVYFDLYLPEGGTRT